MLKAMLSSFFCLLISSHAFAGFLLEPYVGYESQTITATIKTSNADAGGTGTAIALGARLGWAFGSGFWTALDGMTAMNGSFNPTTSSTNTTTYTRTNIGLTLGYNFSNKLRMYFGYDFSPSSNVTDSNGGTTSTTKYTGGPAYKLGIGRLFTPSVAVNLEYFNNSPATYETSGGTTGDTSALFSAFTDAGFRLIVSFPFGGGK